MSLTIVATSTDTTALEAQVAEAQATALAAHDVATKAEADALAADQRAGRAMTRANAADATSGAAHQIAVDADAKTTTLAQQQAQLESLAATLGAAIPASEATHAAINKRIDDEATARTAADSTSKTRIDGLAADLTTEVQARAAAVSSEVAARKTADDAETAARIAADAGLVGRAAALEAAVAALQALKVTVGFGVANLPGSLAAGATTNVVVTLSRDMGSTTYSVGYGLSGGTSLLGQLQATGVVAQTKTTVTVAVKNSGLTALLNLSTAALSVVAARDA